MPDAAAPAVTLTQIGTVEVARIRIYDMPGARPADKATAHVQPGHYPVLRRTDGSVFWLMTARRADVEVNTTHLDDRPVGGLMMLSVEDGQPSGEPFMISSPVIPAEEFPGFVEDANAHPHTPVRFTLTEAP